MKYKESAELNAESYKMGCNRKFCLNNPYLIEDCFKILPHSIFIFVLMDAKSCIILCIKYLNKAKALFSTQGLAKFQFLSINF